MVDSLRRFQDKASHSEVLTRLQLTNGSATYAFATFFTGRPMTMIMRWLAPNL